MKKSTLGLVVTLAMTLVMAVTLTACGGSKAESNSGGSPAAEPQDSRVDFHCFKADVPEGVTKMSGDLKSPLFEALDEHGSSQWKILMDESSWSTDTAESCQADRLSYDEEYVKGEDVTIGDYARKPGAEDLSREFRTGSEHCRRTS